MEFLARFFKLKENKTTVSTEIIAGITTFMSMAYILAVNPQMLAAAGMDPKAVFTATALASMIGTLCMSLMANLPFALAPGMGLNAFFGFTIGAVYGWQTALLAVFVEGVIFILLTLFRVREAIFMAVPKSLKFAISVGIGLFICFIGLSNCGLVVPSTATTVTLGNVKGLTVILSIIGVIVTVVLIVKKVKGALLWGILATYVLGLICQLTGLYVPNPDAGMFSLYPTNSTGQIALFSAPPSISGFNLISALQSGAFSNFNLFNFIVVVLAFLYIDIFDTIATLIGVSEKAGFVKKDGSIPNLKQALLADAIGTTAGAVLGTSTVTTYVESATGVSEGGRTGLTAAVVGVLFLASLFFSPVFTAIPGFATAPALIVTGLYMIETVTRINFTDFTEGFPAFLCIVMMPLTYSISTGLAFGVISFVVIKLLTGRAKDLNIMMYIVTALFILNFIFG